MERCISSLGIVEPKSIALFTAIELGSGWSIHFCFPLFLYCSNGGRMFEIVLRLDTSSAVGGRIGETAYFYMYLIGFAVAYKFFKLLFWLWNVFQFFDFETSYFEVCAMSGFGWVVFNSFWFTHNLMSNKWILARLFWGDYFTFYLTNISHHWTQDIDSYLQ